MKAIHCANPSTLDGLHLVEIDSREPGPGEICVRVRASSLNFHDYLVVSGAIPVPEGRIPMSDGAGTVEAVGSGVTSFKPGDDVLSVFLPDWVSGPPTPETRQGAPGDTADGFASQTVTLPAAAFTRMPQGLSHGEAATLTCAGLTAWRAMFVDSRVKAGDTVLVQGTGGVSILALQFAKAVGARVIATSSSDTKLERLKALGADHVINYREDPQWGSTAFELTGGRGVDEVIEVGGPGTLTESINACRMGAHISLIGVLTGLEGEVQTFAFMAKSLRMTGITVGSRADQEEMIRAVEAGGIKPFVDRTFPLAELADAFRYQESQKHFGKIGVEV